MIQQNKLLQDDIENYYANLCCSGPDAAKLSALCKGYATGPVFAFWFESLVLGGHYQG